MAGLAAVNSVIRVPVSLHASALPSTEPSFFSGRFFSGVQDGCLQLPEFCASFFTSSQVSLSVHSLQDPGALSDWTGLGHMAMAESMGWPWGWTELVGLA